MPKLHTDRPEIARKPSVISLKMVTVPLSSEEGGVAKAKAAGLSVW